MNNYVSPPDSLARTTNIFPLEVIFVIPYKGMAIEGYYLPGDGTSAREALVRGNSIARETLDGIVANAGIPSRVLYETDVEHEVSCKMNEPEWFIRWEDVRPVDGEEPDAVIEHAYRKFTTIHRNVVEHTMGTPPSANLQPRLSLQRAGLSSQVDQR